MVTFDRCEAPATEQQIDELERRIGLRLPSGLRRLFREANGGRPHPNVYRDEEREADVLKCLALREGQGSALWTYETLVLTNGLVPKSFFPFAMDPSSDCFFVDCASPDERVYLYVHDTAFQHLRRLNSTFDEFWTRLVEE